MASVKQVRNYPASRLIGNGANLLRFETRQVLMTQEARWWKMSERCALQEVKYVCVVMQCA
jgi:hypothetical protein